jgi:type II secretory pathway pseudopilin PulG
MKKTSSSAFTLIEALLALALGGVVITCAAMMLMTFMQLWLDQEKGEDFTGQVENVTRFLTTYLRTPPAVPSEKPVPALSFQNLDKDNVKPETGLAFWFRELPPFIENPKVKLRCPAIAQLSFKKDKGLYLIVQALPDKNLKAPKASSEKAKAKNDLVTQTVLLSPLVVGLEYSDYNAESKQWKVSEKFESDAKDSKKMVFPNYLKVTFKSKAGKVVTSYIYLRQMNPNIPTF